MAAISFTHSELKDWLADNFIVGEEKNPESTVSEVKLTKKQADDLVKMIFGKITEEVVAGKDVKMLGLGTVKRVLRQERTGRNPQTNENIVIPAHYAIKLDAEKSIKDTLKNIPVDVAK